MDKVYQCCYTNAERTVAGQVRDSGWEFVNVSKDFPKAAMQACQNRQKRCSSMMKNMRDERGKEIRDFYEVAGNGSYLFVTRTRYGLRDRVGRPNLFSHAFVFPAESAAPYPEAFLYPDFKASIEETSDCNPQILKSSVPLGEDIKNAGLGDREAYAALIQCAYLQMAAQSETKYPLLKAPASLRDAPLYIQYDGAPEQFQRLLRCLYSALPYYLRARLSASVYASAQDAADARRNLIFTTDAKARDGSYFLPPAPGNPGSGENNVASALNKKNAEIIGNSYISYAARFLEADLFAPFFEGLDACAKDLGDASASDDRILNIAWKYFWNQETLEWSAAWWDRDARRFSLRKDMSAEDLKRLLSNIFACEIYSGGLADLARQIVETVGTDSMTDNLREKWRKYSSGIEPNEPAPGVNSVNSEKASDIEQQFAANPEEAVKHLLEIPPSIPDNALKYEFSRFSGTPEILGGYCKKLLESNPVTWDSLRRARMALNVMPKPNDLGSILYQIANQLCAEDIMSRNNPAFALREYERTVKTVMQNPEDVRETVNSMRALYWNNFDFRAFDFRKADEYEAFRIEGKENKALALLELAEQYMPGDEREFLPRVHAYFTSFEGEISPAERLTIVNELCERLKTTRYTPYLYEDWVKWASYANVGKGYIELLASLYEALNPFDVSKLLNACVSFLHWSALWDTGKWGEDEKRRIVGRIESSCIQNDSISRVPLDLWLLIGSQTCRNPFEELDNLWTVFQSGKAFKKAPAIFQQAPAEVVRSSVELRFFQEQARLYAHSPGDKKPRKLVEKWLNELEKLNPAQPVAWSAAPSPFARQPATNTPGTGKRL